MVPLVQPPASLQIHFEVATVQAPVLVAQVPLFLVKVTLLIGLKLQLQAWDEAQAQLSVTSIGSMVIPPLLIAATSRN